MIPLNEESCSGTAVQSTPGVEVPTRGFAPTGREIASIFAGEI